MKIEFSATVIVMTVSLLMFSCSVDEKEDANQLPDRKWLFDRVVNKSIEPDSALFWAKRLYRRDTITFVDAYTLAMAYQTVGFVDSAMDMYYKTLEIDSSWADAHSQLAYLYLELDSPRRALYHALKADSISPRPYTKTKIADSYLFMDSFEKPIEIYENLIRDSVETKENLYHLGTAYMFINEDENSVKVLKRLVKEYPEFSQGWHALGLTYSLMGEKDFAIQNYLRSYRLNPQGDEAYTIARKYLEKNMLDSACFYYKEALRLESDIAGTQEIDTVFCENRLVGVTKQK